MSSPGHLGFSHPKEIHVTGENREMGVGGRCHTSPRVPIAEKDIHDQLQACLPADWLPKEQHPFKEQRHRDEGAGPQPALCSRRVGGRPSGDLRPAGAPPTTRSSPTVVTLAMAQFPEPALKESLTHPPKVTKAQGPGKHLRRAPLSLWPLYFTEEVKTKTGNSESRLASSC